MMINNINASDIDDEKEEGCDCCDGECDCGDCPECGGESNDTNLNSDDNYINEYSDGNEEDDSRLYGRALESDNENDDYN